MNNRNRLINKYSARNWLVTADNDSFVLFVKNDYECDYAVIVRFTNKGAIQSANMSIGGVKKRSVTQYDKDVFNTVHYWSEW